VNLFDEIDRKAGALAQIGERVRAEARATGTTMSYTEPAYGTDIIVEYSDGRRERLTPGGVAVPIPPREH
jgi:hypothetical protein